MAKTKVTVKTPDFGRLKKALDDLRKKTGKAIVTEAQENAPVNTGNYKSEIRYDEANTVTANAKYSAAIEYGTQPHDILPNTQKALAFQINGKDIIVKKVHHSGTRPNPVMRSAAATVQKQIPQIWQEALKENGL